MRNAPVDINTTVAQIHHLPIGLDSLALTSLDLKEGKWPTGHQSDYKFNKDTKVMTRSPKPRFHDTEGIAKWTSLQTKYLGSEDELDLFNAPEEVVVVGPARKKDLTQKPPGSRNSGHHYISRSSFQPTANIPRSPDGPLHPKGPQSRFRRQSEVFDGVVITRSPSTLQLFSQPTGHGARPAVSPDVAASADGRSDIENELQDGAIETLATVLTSAFSQNSAHDAHEHMPQLVPATHPDASVPVYSTAPATGAATSGRVLRFLRLSAPLANLNADSSLEDQMALETALGTEVAPMTVLREHAQLRGEAAEALCRTVLRAAMRDTASSGRYKGKRKEAQGFTTPRWSNVSEFEERLEALLGPGSINRGLGKRPRNVPRTRNNDHVSNATGHSDHSSPQPDVVMEDESHTTVVRRRRQIRNTKVLV